MKYDIHKKLNELQTEEDLFNFLQIQTFELQIKDFIDFIDTYQSVNNKKGVFEQLKGLGLTQVELGIFKQDKLLGEVYAIKTMSLLRNYTRIGNSNKITYQLEPEILLNWVVNPKPFVKLYLKIQTKLKLYYSKVLYEICKDYEKIGSVTKPFNDWLNVLGVEKNSNTKTPGKLKAFYLKKAIKEINEHTDIFIDDITGLKKDGETTMTITLHKQKCALIDDLKDDLPIEEQIIQNKLNHKSKTKLLKLEKTGYIVKDEKAWMKADVNKNKDLYEAQYKLDDYISLLNEMKQQERLTLLGNLSKFVQANDPVVLVNNYIITDLSGNPLTSNAIETRKVIIEFQEKEQDV